MLDTSGNDTGSSKGSGTTRTSEGYDTVGGAADLWGNSLTEAWVENSNFGVALEVINTDLKDGFNVYVDHMQIKVYYTAPAASNQMMIMNWG